MFVSYPPAIAPARVLDALLVLTLTLALGRIILLFSSQPVVRRRICIFTLMGCLLATPLAVLPNLPRFHLGLLNETQLVASAARGDVGLIPTGGNVSDQAIAPTHTLQKPQPSPSFNLTLPMLWHTAVTIYLICAAILAIRLLLGMTLVHRYIATATPARGKLKQLWRQIAQHSYVELKISTTLPRPITAGVWTPVVLVPESLANRPDHEALRAMLLHEFAHTRRRDTLACLLASIAHVVFFFHPLVWWTTRDLHRSQEILADSWAADKMGDAEKYVAKFLDLTRSVHWASRLMIPAVEAFRRHSEFYYRMKFVLMHEHKVEMRCRKGVTLVATLIILAGITGGAMTIGEKPSSITSPQLARISTLEARGIQFLLTQQQPNGGWMTQYGPGITASVIKILLRAGYAADSPELSHALTYIESTQQPDGGFYIGAHPTYNTAIVVSALAMIHHPRIEQRVERAHAFIRSMRRVAQQQASAAQPTDKHSFYQAAAEVEALRSLGLPPGDPMVTAAFKDMTDAANASAERADSLRLPRYGSMTYAELKSMLYAGLSRDDPRVRGILACIQEYYTLEHNPGDGSYRGQYYFYHSFAKAMRAYGQDIIVDARGQRHDWKLELGAKLASLQRPDGSWVNTQAQEYLEHDPVLVTVYCVLALQEMRESGR